MLDAARMGHPLRWFLPGVVYEITTRTMQERFLLRPSPQSREIILGVIGRALLLYGRVRVHAFVFLSDHWHLLASADDGESLSAFVGYVNGRVGWELGRLHGWSGHFWSRRGRPIPILDDDALIGRLRYVIAQGCKEGLVDSPLDWPGASAVPALVGDMTLEGAWFNRDQERRTRARGEQVDRYDFAIRYRFELAPIPPWAHLSQDELRARHRELVRSVEEETRANNARERCQPLGAARVAAEDPLQRAARSKRTPAPTCHASSHGLRERFRAAYRAFVSAFRVAAAELRKAAPTSLPPRFPPGAFPPRLPYIPASTAAALGWVSCEGLVAT